MTAPRALDWQQKCEHQARRLWNILSVSHPVITRVYCELPQHFEGARGAAAEARGDIIKLTYMVAGYGLVCAFKRVPFEHVPVINWKGQLSKETVEKRVRRIIGEDTFRQLNIRRDIVDAVGLGLWVKGLL